MFFAGVLYAWSILKAPLAVEFDWSVSELTLNFTLTMCMFCLGGMISGLLHRKCSSQAILAIAGGCAFTGFMLTAQLSGSLLSLYLSYGCLCGLGIGMAYNTIVSSLGVLFPDQKGLCSGVLMMSFGASTLILGSLADVLFRMPGIGWRTVYRLLGILIGSALFAAGGVAVAPQADPPFVGNKSDWGGGYSTLEMLREPVFLKFFLYLICLSSVGNSVVSFARDFALFTGFSIPAATVLVGILSICNGLGRIFSGACFDAFGRKRTVFAASLFAIAASAISMAAALLAVPGACAAGLCFAGLSYGCGPTLCAAVTAQFFGERCFALNFSITNMMLIPSSVIALVTANIILGSGGYVAPYAMLLLLAVISLKLGLSLRQPVRREKNIPK